MKVGFSMCNAGAVGLFPCEHPTVLAANAAAVVMSVIMLFAILVHVDSQERWHQVAENLLAALGGAIIGWLGAMFHVPYSNNQAHLFAGIGTTIGAFFSGYLVTKIDRVIEAKIKRMNDHNQPAAKLAARSSYLLGLFIVAMIGVAAVVTTNRAEWLDNNNYQVKSPPVTSTQTHDSGAAHGT